MRRWILLAGMGLLTAACSTSSGLEADQEDLPTTTVSADESDETSPSDDLVFESTTLAITPGGTAVGRLLIGDTSVDYVTAVPADFEVGDGAPVLLAFPPGGQDLELTETIVKSTYVSEAVDRGWVVVSPAAPGGQLFFDGSEELVPALMDWIEGWVEPEGSGFHLAGISNGGLSVFRVAGQNPTRVRSMVVFPGFPRSEADREALPDLASVPIRMFVGADDSGWRASMEQTKETLDELGADATLEIVADQGHFIRTLGDGARIFEELDALR